MKDNFDIFTYYGGLKSVDDTTSFFVTSVYTDTDGLYYTHTVNNQIIQSFVKLEIEKNMFLVESLNLRFTGIHIGDMAIYTFIYSNNIVSGTFWELQEILLPYLKYENLSTIVKLQIASFLRRYIEVDELNKELKLKLSSHSRHIPSYKKLNMSREIDNLSDLKIFVEQLKSYKLNDIQNYFVFSIDKDEMFFFFDNRKISLRFMCDFIKKDLNDGVWLLNF